MLVGNEFGIVLAGDKARDRLHRAGAIEGYNCGNIFNRMGLEAKAHAGHAGGLHLEHTGGFTRRQHLKDLVIMVGDVIKAEVGRVLLHHLHRVIQHRQVTQTQEVHLQKAQFLQRDHVELADDGIVIPRQGHVFIDRTLGDDHTGGVGGGMARHTLQSAGSVDELADTLIPLIEVGELAAHLQSIVQRNVEGGRHKFCHHIHLGVGHVEGTAHIADGATGGHSTKGDDLGHAVIAVLLADIVHHLAAACVAEVHINIGHGHALGVQEALKIEVVGHGVYVRNIKTIGHHRACGTASARANGNAAIFSITDKVGDNEEIVGKAHLLDHLDLVGKLGAIFLLLSAIAIHKALVAELAKIGGGIKAGRQREFRQVVLTESEFQITPLGNTYRVLHGLIVAGEQRRHLLGGAEIELLRLIAHAVFIVHRLACLNAQKNIVALSILGAEIVGIVGADQGDARFLMHPQ